MRNGRHRHTPWHGSNPSRQVDIPPNARQPRHPGSLMDRGFQRSWCSPTVMVDSVAKVAPSMTPRAFGGSRGSSRLAGVCQSHLTSWTNRRSKRPDSVRLPVPALRFNQCWLVTGSNSHAVPYTCISCCCREQPPCLIPSTIGQCLWCQTRPSRRSGRRCCTMLRP